MKSLLSLFFIIVLISSSLVSYALNSGDGEVANYNFGAILRLDIFGNQAKLLSPAGGIASNLEVLVTETHNLYINFDGPPNIALVDSSLKLAMGLLNNKNPDIFLNIRGNFTGGVQAFSFIPLTLSIEDVELYVAGDVVSGTHLLGVALILPVGHILKINNRERQLVLTSTIGIRGNSAAPENERLYPAMQLKLKFLESNNRGENRVSFSAYSSFLYDLNNKANLDEKKGTFGVAVNNIIGLGTQVVVEGAYSKLNANDQKSETGSIIFFVGSNML